MVTDDEVQLAVDYLRDSSPKIGAARMDVQRSESMIKHIEALMFLASTRSSVDAKKAEARASERWIEAVEKHAVAVGEFEKLKGYREAAAAKLEVWRTMSANLRGLRAL